jgi:phage I-like protein
MVAFICILMAIAALAFVLFVEPEAASAPMVDEQLMPLLRKKEILYENLRDLLFEFRMGKLSEADYTESKRTAQAELVPLMSALDELNAKKMREEVTPPPGWCVRCSFTNPDNNAFCGNCGAPLKKKKR